MQLGWLITLILHGTILLLAVFSFGGGSALKFDDIKPVEVEIVSLADIEQVGKKKTKDLVTKNAIKQPIKKPVKRPSEQQKTTEKPKDEPKVTPKKVKLASKPKAVELIPTLDTLIADAIKTPTKEVMTFKKITSAPKPLKRPPLPTIKPEEIIKSKPIKQVEKKAETTFDDDKISALLDKLETPIEEIDLDFGDIETGSVESTLLEDVEVASLSRFEFNAVKRHMASCWSIPAGAQDAGNVVVKIGFRLNQNAEVIGQPRILNYSSHPSFNIMAESAISAIIDCAPYNMLPPEKYDVWNEFSMEFDPREMFNG